MHHVSFSTATPLLTPSSFAFRRRKKRLQEARHQSSANRPAFGIMSVSVKNEDGVAINALKEGMSLAHLKEPSRMILDKCEPKNAVKNASALV